MNIFADLLIAVLALVVGAAIGFLVAKVQELSKPAPTAPAVAVDPAATQEIARQTVAEVVSVLRTLTAPRPLAPSATDPGRIAREREYETRMRQLREQFPELAFQLEQDALEEEQP